MSILDVLSLLKAKIVKGNYKVQRDTEVNDRVECAKQLELILKIII